MPVVNPIRDGAVHQADDGRWYLVDVNTGRVVYLSPVAMGEAAPPDRTGIFRARPRWNSTTGEWDTPVDWGNIVSLVTAGLLTAGMADAIMSGGAAAAGTAGTSGAGTAGATTGAGAGAGAGVGGVAGTATGAGTGAAVGAGAGGAASTIGRVATGVSTADRYWQLIAELGTSLLGGVKASQAAGEASRAQADATRYAADRMAEGSQRALELQERQYYTNLAHQLPWIQTGQAAVRSLGSLMGISAPSGVAPLPQPRTLLRPTSPRPPVVNPPGREATPPPVLRAIPRPLNTVGMVSPDPRGGGFTVQDPDGGTHRFPSEVQAYTFAQQAQQYARQRSPVGPGGGV